MKKSGSDWLNLTNDVENIKTNYVKLADLQGGITFDKLSATNLTINGTNVCLEGHTHDLGDIKGIESKLDATNGVAYGKLQVKPIPDGQGGSGQTSIEFDGFTVEDANSPTNTKYGSSQITYGGETYSFSTNSVD